MENISKAVVMAGHVLIFLVAVSVGIVLYQTLIDTQDRILLSSENYSREAEHVRNDFNTKRVIKGSELVAVLISTLNGTGFDSPVVNIAGYSDNPIYEQGNLEKINRIKYGKDLANIISLDENYSISYSYDAHGALSSVTYEKEP